MEQTEDYRTFRPRWGQVAAWVVAVIAVGGSVLVAFVSRGPIGSNPGSRLSFALFAVVAAWLLWRLGGVHAVPSPQGLRVRNVIYTRRLDWAQIVAVRFSVHDPWVRLDLSDGATLAVMGIQRADGERGMAEARRLAELVARHGQASERP
ncbi:PH domain-containing protein [Xylanimonas oleitrophica]|uniref:PH domain-containing protein n=1 Tax=Xylanimonas oleitrophica TaxID=2607479 RepID=UPI001FE68902|nr:PH domain-containing protein [Xylanimonas oleitrophica]